MGHFHFTTLPLEYNTVDGSLLVMGESDSGRTSVKIEHNVFERLAKGPCPNKDSCILALVKNQATLEQAALRALLRSRNGKLRVTLEDVAN
jgi:hypothetical protein